MQTMIATDDDHPGKIVKAVIIPSNGSKSRYQAVLMVEMSTGELCDVFEYFDDELHFYPGDFEGLTYRQAVDAFHAEDIRYLRS